MDQSWNCVGTFDAADGSMDGWISRGIWSGLLGFLNPDDRPMDGWMSCGIGSRLSGFLTELTGLWMDGSKMDF